MVQARTRSVGVSASFPSSVQCSLALKKKTAPCRPRQGAALSRAMGRLLKRPHEALEDADEVLKRLPPRLYVYPEVVDEMARQQQRGLAFYGSCVEPPESTGACIAPPHRRRVGCRRAEPRSHDAVEEPGLRWMKSTIHSRRAPLSLALPASEAHPEELGFASQRRGPGGHSP